MPKLKQPSKLTDLSIAAIGKHVLIISQYTVSAICSGRTAEISIIGLHQLIHGGLPVMLSREMTTHMFSVVNIISENLKISERTFGRIGGAPVKNTMKRVILASLSPHTITLDLSLLPRWAQDMLAECIYTLNTLSTDSTEVLPLKVLNFLVCFKMTSICNDSILDTLVSCCFRTIQQIHVENSSSVTDDCFKIMKKCPKLTHLLINGTRITSEGFVKYLKLIQQYKNYDKILNDFLHLSVGGYDWEISSKQLSEIAISSPKLRKLGFVRLIGDMEMLGNLSDLEELEIRQFDIQTCNLDTFLRLRGSKLKSLKLDQNNFNSPISLTSIMNHCRNLKEVRILHSSIMGTDLEHITSAAEAFQNLEIIDLSFSTYSVVWIERVLETSVNIKSLFLYNGINDEVILRLLSKKALQKLTLFRAAEVYMSMTSVDALMEQCPFLESLGYLQRWHFLADDIIHTLRHKIEDNNYDLRIQLKWY